tara:strand:- start:35569 stop:38682 length:3114 start_codon:yes stop_codon:yes gene_type:complete
MTAPFDDELVQHADALYGLARALVGARDADDVVQDTALTALQRPPRRSGSILGWLVAVLRHRAMKQRRGERRRVVREQQVVGRDDEAEALSPLGAAQHREMVARLDAALIGLAQPYQDTLLLRYFEDLTPSEIAARNCESIATVKSRLQRGLAMLRQRLDADRGGRDWRAGLVLTFGLGPNATATAMKIGIAFMTTKLVLGAAAAVFAWILLWPGGEIPVVAPVQMSGESNANAALATAPAELPQSSDRELVAAGPGLTSTAVSDSLGVAFSGRCIDESGTPLAGVHIDARARRRNSNKALARVEEVTSGDGVFAVELPIIDGTISQFELHLDGRCSLEGTFADMQPGELHALGDLVMTMAHTVRGRVVDVAGAPQVGVSVRLVRDNSGGRDRALVDVRVVTTMKATTDDLGRFAFRYKLPADRYWLRLGNRQLVDPSARDVTLAGPLRERVLELVVEAAPPPCRGIVVGPDGSAIAGAYVSLDDNHTTTGTDGCFELLPTPGGGRGDRRLEVSASGFMSIRDHLWRFGDTDQVRVALQPVPAVTLRVVDGRTGAPVLDYAAQLVHSNAWGIGLEVARGEHANGMSQVSAPPGRYLVVVTPVSEELLRSTFQPVELPSDRSAEVTVALWPPIQRRLIVTDGRGPVAGVSVQLLDPGELQVRFDTETWTLEDCKVTGPPLARIVQEGETEADGSIVLRGPKGPLALRLSGAGLALQVVQPISLDAADDLTVPAQRGATWRGRLVPAEVAREVVALGERRPNIKLKPVGIRLVRDGGESLHRYLERPFPIAADGSFEISGIPAGTWNAIVKAKSRYAAATIRIVEGQMLERDLDIAAFAAADVNLRILVDGAPASDCDVNAMGWHAKDAFGQRFTSQRMGRTDADGRFSLRTFVGDLELRVYWRAASGKRSILRAYTVVPHAGEQQSVLDLRIGALDVSVLQADGTPAVGLQLREAGRKTGWIWTTDAEGQLRQRPILAGSYVIEARPRSLSTQAARDAFTQVHGYQAIQREWVPCGVVTVSAGSAVQQRLQLPSAWNR